MLMALLCVPSKAVDKYDKISKYGHDVDRLDKLEPLALLT